MIDKFTKEWEKPFTLEDLVQSYELKVRHGRYTFFNKSKRNQLRTSRLTTTIGRTGSFLSPRTSWEWKVHGFNVGGQW